MGAAARAMANFGFRRLRVVKPYDVAFREARSAVGAAPLLRAAKEFASTAEAVADCRLVVGTTSVGHRALQHPIRRLEYGARLIKRALAEAPVGLLFGSEKFGLSNDDMSFCHALIRIPTTPETPSMNLGQAVAVCLYELIREETAVRSARFEAMAGADAEQLTKMLHEVLDASGYTNRITATSTERKIRRWMRRLRIGRRDAPLLLGILRQILWKFEDRR